MTLGILISISVVLLFLPTLTVIPLYRKFGDKLPNKYAILWWVCVITYYVGLFNLAPAWLNKHYPAEIHKENICEVKTTYSRKGIQ